MVMKFLPGVPYVHTQPGARVREERQRLRAEPGRHRFSSVSIGWPVSLRGPARPAPEHGSRRTRRLRCSGSSFADCCCSSRSCSGSRSSSSSGSGRCRERPPQALLGERATPQTIRADQPSVRARQADLRAVLALPRADGRSCNSARRSRRARPVLTEIGQRFPGDHRAGGRGDDLRDRRSGSRSASSRRSGTARWFDHVVSSVSLLGISIPIFFLALILKYIFAVRLGWLPTRRPQISVLINIPHPTNFYLLDALLDREPGRVLGRRPST